ncbi:hypothetical protein [Halodesulfovibrio marinisediminis]|uniref:Uncharacterized protein n=1 Tax=Halodesulfovibrio marinisediminis DSM 17456 TaxID=1121457 RepID=A0A1N6F8S0_9BACT|nr:hypothetical protein [Halodesulfovibrio marinisediminis]SIN91683.1 hypothetical protein SAMN02745161_1171 [Halodesulfovibrio marinisediminis DSM 17456]
MSSYEKWSLAIQALSALGTIGAVVVALFLAMKPPKPNFIVASSIRKIVAGVWKGTVALPESFEVPDGAHQTLGVLVTATNIGLHPEGVQHFFYDVSNTSRYLLRWNPLVPHVNTQGTTGFEGGTPFLSTIHPGDCATFFLPLEKFDTLQLPYFIKTLSSSKLPEFIKNSPWYPKLTLRTFRCRVELDRKHTAAAKLDKTLLEYITKKYLQHVSYKTT